MLHPLHAIHMKYDECLLKNWSKMETLEEYLESKGVYKFWVSEEEINMMENKYFDEVKCRIAYCHRIINESEDAQDFVYYVLAELYSRIDPCESDENTFRKPTRRYVIKALRRNRKNSAAWALLADTYSWLGWIYGVNGIRVIELSSEPTPIKAPKQRAPFDRVGKLDEIQVRRIQYAEKAIYYIQKALTLEPSNKKYQDMLRRYYRQRNDEYRGGQ